MIVAIYRQGNIYSVLKKKNSDNPILMGQFRRLQEIKVDNMWQCMDAELNIYWKVSYSGLLYKSTKKLWV